MECSLPWEVVFVGTGPLEGVAEPSVTAELLRAWRTTEGKKKKKTPERRNNTATFSILTCDDQTLVVLESLGEEAGNNELWIDEEQDLLLHQTSAQNTSTDHVAGEIHLHTHTHTKETSPSPLDWNSWSSSAPQVCFYLQHACTFSLDGAVWRHVQFVHRLLTAAAK